MDPRAARIENDLVRLSAILEAIKSFRAGNIGFLQAVDAIYAPYSKLELAPTAWRDEFFELWSDLEIDLALGRNDYKNPLPTAADLTTILDPLERLTADQIQALRDQ